MRGGRALRPGDQPALPVYEEGHGQTSGFKGAHELAARSKAEGEMMKALRYIKDEDLFQTYTIIGNHQDPEVLVAQLGLQGIQRRHFLNAGYAPGGPEVE